MKQYVVMVAGGTGTRMRRTMAKQFLNVKNDCGTNKLALKLSIYKPKPTMKPNAVSWDN